MRAPTHIFRSTCLWLAVVLLTALNLPAAAAPISLRAVPLTLMFEPDNAALRYVKVGPHEVLRGVTAPVRNQFWGTALPTISTLQVDDQGDHFSLRFGALCREREIGEFVGGEVLRFDSSDTLSVVGLALQRGERRRLLIANLTDHSQPASVRGVTGTMSVRHLEDLNAPRSQQSTDGFNSPAVKIVNRDSPLLLPSYGIVRIDLGR